MKENSAKYETLCHYGIIQPIFSLKIVRTIVMTKQIMQFELDDGSPVYVEVEDSGYSDRERVSRRGDSSIEKAQEHFVTALASVRPAAEAVLDTFRELNTPDEINLEFGIKFGGKVGAIIASVDSEATFKVALKWKNERHP